MQKKGIFIISLDFELLWGVRDKKTVDSYGPNIKAVWEVIPRMLETFKKYDVHSTFATVGMLFAEGKEELIRSNPTAHPSYEDANLSPYNGHFDQIEEDDEDRYHFASELIERIGSYPGQEIATHTYSHYYCLEEGQTIDDFEEDINAAIDIASKNDISLESIVFPRNQINEGYLKILKEKGINAYRGNESVWFQSAAKGKDEKLYKRAFRLLDAYLNISGPHTYDIQRISEAAPYNLASSRFLRPFSPKVKFLDGLRISRIKNAMTYAAKNAEVFHLWWHPHNFGSHMEENMQILESILKHYTILNNQYGYQSMNMSEVSHLINAAKDEG